MAQAGRILLGLAAMLLIIGLGALGYAFGGPIGALLIGATGAVLVGDALSDYVMPRNEED